MQEESAWRKCSFRIENTQHLPAEIIEIMPTVNIKQLAHELNLSVSTVSRALTGGYDISEKTRTKVMELAKKLNYQPNPYASSLRRHNSKTIAVVIPEIANNFFSLAINGIQSVAREKGYHVLIYLTHEDAEMETAILHDLQYGRVDGVLISLSSGTHSKEHLLNLKESGLPLVFFDRVCEDIETAKVTTDDYDSGYKATEHLIGQGCKRIAYLLLSKNLSIGTQRMQGYLDALKDNRIKADQKLVLACTNEKEQNHQLISRLLSSSKRPDGIFASVEHLAMTSYQVCRDLGLNIPRDVKIISFSNLEIAGLLDPSLTTIAQPAFDMGKEAASVLFKSLGNKATALSNQKTILPSTLVMRDSTRML